MKRTVPNLCRCGNVAR